MPNRQLYTMKFKSLRLKEYNYNITLTPEEARENGELVALSDNQILRSIRKIHNRQIDYNLLEQWYKERDLLKKQKHSKENAERIAELQNNITNMMFVPEYITIVMEHPSHYEYLYYNGLMLNNKKYIRFSSSASQSRVSTVVFCEEETAKKLNEILDNGRNKNKELCPSKFNAYKGLAGSSTKVVSTPRFCVIPDYKVKQLTKVNFVTETGLDEDDIIEIKEVELEYNRFDGQGLITYRKAKEWAEELGLGYVPAQWCIRQNYIKGMLCVFPIEEFCKYKNNGNYLIDTIYKDENGDPIKVDLREIDVILTESQFKLWDSFSSLEEYIRNCELNDLKWGVALVSPEEPDDILTMNYQFLQTLNFSKEDIKNVCSQFVDWIQGVNFNNIYYTLLFLMGENLSQEKIQSYFKRDDNYWIKSLIVNHDVKRDKYIKNKVYDYIKTKIKRGCLGEIIVDGNFQVLVSDPYAFMEHACGFKEVKGLLGKNEYYCNYWNKKGVKEVDSMRAPLTYRSEHLKLKLKNNKELRRWYRYCDTAGVIVNIHGCETLHWAGSDFDMDIIATTSNKTICNSIFKNELPVVYEVPKPEKKIITDYDLYQADLFAFGSIIGSITNKSTTAYALLPMFKKGSKEYETLMNRIKMCTKLQSAQIDKAKIGREVKGIPSIWVEKQKINKDDSEEVKKHKKFLNSILLDKHPYFFIYLYKETYNKYKKYKLSNDLSCRQKFGISIDELLQKEDCTEEEKSFLNAYKKYLPVVDSDCLMNRLCKYIESINFNIKEKLKTDDKEDIYKLYMNDAIPKDNDKYNEVLTEYKSFMKELRDLGNMGINSDSSKEKYDEDLGREVNNIYESFQNRMLKICSNAYELTNYLVEIFYCEYKGSNKDILWNTFGKYIFENIKRKNMKPVLFPIPNDNGDIVYLNKKYKLEEVII